MGQEKQKKGEREKVKSKSQDCCVTFKPKNYLEVLLSAHSPSSQANILHLDHKAVRPFKPHENEVNSVEDTKEKKQKNHVTMP